MEWAIATLAVVILGLAAVAATGRLGELPSTVTDMPQPHVPDGVLDSADLRGLRFAVVARGYSMQQVDELLDRLAAQLDGIVPEPAAASLTEPAGAGPSEPVPLGFASPEPTIAQPSSVNAPVTATPSEPVDRDPSSPGVADLPPKPLSPPEPIDAPLKPLSPPEPVAEGVVMDAMSADEPTELPEPERVADAPVEVVVPGSVEGEPIDQLAPDEPFVPEANADGSFEPDGQAPAEPEGDGLVEPDGEALEAAAAANEAVSAEEAADEVPSAETEVSAPVAEVPAPSSPEEPPSDEQGSPDDLAEESSMTAPAPIGADSNPNSWSTAEESLRHLEELIARLSGKNAETSYGPVAGSESGASAPSADNQPGSPSSAPQQG